ncbi:MAG TPA: TetR/AcrR family transcriptional regulator [Terriglobia bacterium]|nr:TetR/AcrR family transcriptional regulator [Terriglobia bacterium]
MTGKPLKTRDGGAVRAKSEETRNRILNTALELFRKDGFDETTMRQIAAECGVALGAAYYYFPSKDALVMAFYERAQSELEPILVEELSRHKSIDRRLRALIEAKLRYFHPNRALIGKLSAHIDPRHPLSPFSSETQAIRDQDIQGFARVLESPGVRVPPDIRLHLPRILWLYQMGLLLYWVYDRSPQQRKTVQLLDGSLSIVALLIRLIGLPFLRGMRKHLVALLETLDQGNPAANLRQR